MSPVLLLAGAGLAFGYLAAVPAAPSGCTGPTSGSEEKHDDDDRALYRALFRTL